MGDLPSLRAHPARDRRLGRHHRRPPGRPASRSARPPTSHRARPEGQIGVIYGFQNAVAVGDDPGRVATFARARRARHPAHLQPGQPPRRRLDGAGEPRPDAVRPARSSSASNAHRVMVDLSHSGERTCLDAARTPAQPISINHTGCRALADLPRNKTDEELRLVADARRLRRHLLHALPQSVRATPTAADVVAHIEHAVNVCGEDHVGIGTDGPITPVDDLDAYRRAARRARGPAARGRGRRGRGARRHPARSCSTCAASTSSAHLVRLLERARLPLGPHREDPRHQLPGLRGPCVGAGRRAAPCVRGRPVGAARSSEGAARPYGVGPVPVPPRSVPSVMDGTERGGLVRGAAGCLPYHRRVIRSSPRANHVPGLDSVTFPFVGSPYSFARRRESLDGPHPPAPAPGP